MNNKNQYIKKSNEWWKPKNTENQSIMKKLNNESQWTNKSNE